MGADAIAAMDADMTFRFLPALAACLLAALPAIAEDPWLTPDEFDAMTTGKAVQYFYTDGTLSGTEQHFTGRRVLWNWGNYSDCLKGYWVARSEAVCFHYEDGDVNCMRYQMKEGRLLGVEWDDGQISGDWFYLEITGTGSHPLCSDPQTSALSMPGNQRDPS